MTRSEEVEEKTYTELKDNEGLVIYRGRKLSLSHVFDSLNKELREIEKLALDAYGLDICRTADSDFLKNKEFRKIKDEIYYIRKSIEYIQVSGIRALADCPHGHE